MVVVNFYGGPGSGKSTSAAALFVELKHKGYKVELPSEAAKDLIYEGREIQLENQMLVTALQYAKLKDLERSGCEIAVVDSPLLMGLIYAKKKLYYPELEPLVKQLNAEFTNINVFVMRVKPYETFGRVQSEEEARKLDDHIKELGVHFDYYINGDAGGQGILLRHIHKITCLVPEVAA